MLKKSQFTIALLATLISTSVFAQCIPGGPCRKQKNAEGRNNAYYTNSNGYSSQWGSDQENRSNPQYGNYQQSQYDSQYGYDQYQQNSYPQNYQQGYQQGYQQNYQQNYAPQAGNQPTHLEYSSKDGKFPPPPADHPVHQNQAGGYYQGQTNQGQYMDGNKNFYQSNWSGSSQPSSYHFSEETYGATSVNDPGQIPGTTGSDSSGGMNQRMYRVNR